MGVAALKKRLITATEYLSRVEQKKLLEAIELAIAAHSDQKRNTGEPYVTHPLSVALILSEWQSDVETIIAGLLHDTLEDTKLQEKDIEERFGNEVSQLVQGVTKFSNADFEDQVDMDRKIETLRKLFEVMRSDIRVAVIKLADRLHNVRTIDSLPSDRQKPFAKETMDIYYKLASHLGMNDLRRELGLVCFPILFADEATYLLHDQEQHLEHGRKVLKLFKKDIEKNDTHHAMEHISLRAISLPRLKIHKEKESGEPPYLFICIAKDKDSCYELLKLFHSLYRPISNRFRDYIAVPTENGYQTIRTGVIGPEGNILPVHIRTENMNDIEREGILIKLFKEHKDISGFSWLDRSKEVDDSSQDSSAAFWEGLQTDIFQESISVNVNGEDVTVPKGSTILDAIYALHRKDGNRATSFMLNGVPESPARTIEEEDVIAFKLDGKDHINVEWLSYVATTFARSIIAKSLRRRGQHTKLSRGQRLLQKEFDYFNKGLIGEMSHADKEQLTKAFKRTNFEEVIGLIGEGVIRPRDVVFELFPEHSSSIFSLPFKNKKKSYPFDITITGAEDEKKGVLSQLLALANTHDASINQTHIERYKDHSTFSLTLRGKCPDRLHYADLISSLERQDYVSSVVSQLPLQEKIFLFGAAIFSVLIVFLDFLILPTYLELQILPQFLQNLLPLLPILGVNYLLLRLLEHYTVWLRKETWFLGIGCLINVLGILFITWRYTTLQEAVGVIPTLFIFMIAMLLMGSKLVQRIFVVEPHISTQPLTKEEKKHLRNQKITGYTLRIIAVCIWGIIPVFVRYSELQQLSPLLRVHLWSLIGAITTYLAIIIYNNVKKKTEESIPIFVEFNKYFWMIVIANICYNYFLHKSLLYTTATHVNLVMSYAPIISLLIGFVIWRKYISYFQNSKSMQHMLIVFGMSALGGTLLLFSDFIRGDESIIGDLFALLVAIADVVFIMTNIYYFKYSNLKTNTLTLTAQHLLWISIATFIMILGQNTMFDSNISASALSLDQWVYMFILGIGSSIGFVLTFEAFKRIDGIIAFLLFSLTPIIAFIPEILLYDFKVSIAFVIGAILIISSSIAAEIINSNCQNKGL